MSHPLTQSVLWLFLLLCAAGDLAQAQEKLLWGDLQPGPYAVGFRSLYQQDESRLYDSAYPSTKPHKKTYRPLFIAVWYPARRTLATPMLYRDYFAVASGEARYTAFSQRLQQHFLKVAQEEVVSYHPMAEWREAEHRAWERLLALPTYSVRDAPPASGRFPLILAHPGLGGGYEDNSALYEYLASQGYVIVSSAFPSEEASTLGIDWNLPRSFKDLTFLLHYARTLPSVDPERLAVLGHSYGAQAGLAWRSEANSPVDAVVALDSTVEYTTPGEFAQGFQPLKALLDANTKANRSALAVPILRFASQEGKPNFEILGAYMKFTPRYEVVTTALEHNDYLTHCAVKHALLPEPPDGAPHGDTRRAGYYRVCRTVHAFLDATLKGNAAEESRLQRGFDGTVENAGLTLRYQEPVQPPPTSAQLLQILRTQHIEAAEELLRRCRNDIEPPLFYRPVAYLLESDRKADCLRLLHLWFELFPGSARACEKEAELHVKYGETEQAIAAYQRALEKIASDPMFDKDPEGRAAFTDKYRKALEALHTR